MNHPLIAVWCSGVTKSFPVGDGMVEVLHGIDFEVPAGELTMLVGPSGCGKTTLIPPLSPMQAPDPAVDASRVACAWEGPVVSDNPVIKTVPMRTMVPAPKGNCLTNLARGFI